MAAKRKNQKAGPKFQIGDRVRLVRDHWHGKLQEQKGTIKGFFALSGGKEMAYVLPDHFPYQFCVHLNTIEKLSPEEASMGHNCVFIEPGRAARCGKPAANICTVINWKGEEKDFSICPIHIGALYAKARAVKAKVCRLKKA
jgi:hypothetical protein